MKASCLLVTLAVGMWSAAPAHAFGYWNNATYASRFRPDPPAATQANPKFQIAVVANMPSQPAATKAAANAPRSKDAAHPFGPPRPYAVHSH